MSVLALVVKFKAAVAALPLVAAVTPSKLRALKFLISPAVFWVEALFTLRVLPLLLPLALDASSEP